MYVHTYEAICVFTAGVCHLTTQVLVSLDFVEDTIMIVNILSMEALTVVHNSRF